MLPQYPHRYSEPAPGKRARIFFWSQPVNGYVVAPREVVAALGEQAFNYDDDKIEVLVLKRIDMSDAEFAALPVVDAARVVRREKP